MDRPTPTSTPDEHDADQALRDARSRFVAGFTQRHSAMGTLLTKAPDQGAASLTALREAAHKLAGLAGVLGFPSVSEHAAALEVVLLQEPLDVTAATAALARMGAGFTRDLAGAAPSWATDARPAAAGARLLIVEDDQEQRRLAASGLRAAGYRVATAESGSEAVATAQAERPDLILLGVDLPGLDGMSVCRQLKLTPALASVPIMFCTARANVMDRMAGLSLGADDYITKPYAPGELLLRIKHLLARGQAVATAPLPKPDGVLTYDLFATAADAIIRDEPAALVLLHVPAEDAARVCQTLLGELRRRDLLGRMPNGDIVMLAPGMTAAAARDLPRALLDNLSPPVANAAIGAVDSSRAAPGAATLEPLLAEADLALAADRVARAGHDGKTTILLAEDDADVQLILDTRLRAAGYRTILAFDGAQTLAALDQESPAIIVLDLMMPKLTGFDVLTRLRQRGPQRPRAIVLSARGRDEDVTRAFELGADDYVTKPFNPDELMARIARLAR
jgi:DNA-binding response OmpR family regulator